MYAIDIETMPNLDMVKYLPDLKANKTLKDPDKIQANLATKKQEQIDKMALSPEFGKIACIGIYGEDFRSSTKWVIVENEKKILNEFLDFLRENGEKKVVSYNGKGFDFDFIYKRAIFHDLARLSQMKQYTDKYKSLEFHIDLMQEYCKYGEYKTLDLLANIYLGEKKIEFDFKQIPELLKTKEGIEKLKKYCLRDCELTYKLAKKFGY